MPSSDWMKTTRQGIVDHFDQVKDWLMKKGPDKDGKEVTNWVRIGMKPEEFEKFVTLGSDAKNILAVAKDNSRNTKVVTREVKAAFRAFCSYFRKIRALYINENRLTEAEQVECGFTVNDHEPTPGKNPTATIVIRTKLGKNYGEIIAVFEAVSGDLNDRENQGLIFLAWLVLPPGSPPPASVREVNENHIITRRREILIKCGIEKSGWDIYFVARIEQGDRQGEYGPIVKAKLP